MSSGITKTEDEAKLRARIARATALLEKWEHDHAPAGDDVQTPADMCLDDIGEALGLWGEDS